MSKQNLIPGIFSFCCRKLRLFTEEEFLSESYIGLLSSSKYKFRDQGRSFSLTKTPRNSNPSLTLALKNPKILKLVVLVHFLYLNIGEGSGAKTFTGQREIPYLPYVKVSASQLQYSGIYDSSKSGFQLLPRFIIKQDTQGKLLYLEIQRSK